MADESRNPADNYEMRKLRSELQGVVSELKAEAQLAREQAAENARSVQRQSRAAERESTARRNRTGRRVERVTGEVLPAEEATAARSTARDQERIADARRRGARFAADSAQAAERELGYVQRQIAAGRSPLLLGAGGPHPPTTVYQPPAARPIPGSGGAYYPPGFYGGGGGGGGLPPGPPPAAPPPPPGGRGRPTGGYVDPRAATANDRFNQSMRESIRMGGQYDDSLRRHGALTTEFFSALARGEITLAELRFQLGATIAKFAGWTAASVLVFGALDAVRQLGKGAIDSSAGVSQLQRYINDVDTGRAQSQFVELAQHFNLPIDDVAQAMAQMGQVFHTQNAAFEATKSALAGVKVGNLSVADSTKFLLAITRGFGLQAGDLEGVFDRINQAQNKFGVGIRDTASGVAKAAGVWHAAGGDVNMLTALIAAGAAKTGRSGDEMGTAFARSAEIIKRGNSKNAEALAAYGINASAPIGQIYRKAFQLVQSGRVQGAEVTRLAAALSTPQLAGRISPILQDPAYFAKVQSTLADSHGSAARELEKTLRSAKEQVAAIGTNLQTVGAEFVRAGGAVPLGLMLHALNDALRVTTDLLQLFNSLPAPLREAAIIGLELAAVMKLASRFGVVPGRGGTPELRRNAQREVEFFREQARFASQDVQRAQFNVGAATARERAATPGTQAAYAASAARERASEAVMEAEARLAFAEQQLALSVEARAAVNDRAAVAGGVPVAPGGGRTPAPGGAPRVAPLGVNLLPDAARAEREAGRVRQQVNRMGGATRGAFNAVTGTFSGLSGLATRSVGRLGGLRGALNAFGGVLRGILSDPLGAGFLAFVAGNALKEHFEARGREYDRIGAGPRSAADARKALLSTDSSDAAQASANAELQILQQQNAQRRAGTPVANLFTSQIRRQAADTLALLKAHKITRDEAQTQLENLQIELNSSRSSPALIALERRNLKAQIAGVGPNSQQSIADILRGLNQKDFAQRLQDDAAAITDYGRRSERLREIAAGYRIALHRARGYFKIPKAPDPELPGVPGVRGAPGLEPLGDLPGPTPEQLALVRRLESPDHLLAKAPRLRSLQRLRGDFKGGPTTENIKALAAARAAIAAVIADSQKRLEAELVGATTLAERERAYDANRRRIAKLPHSQMRSLSLRENEAKRFDDELSTFDARTALGVSRISSANTAARDQYLLKRMNERVAKLRVAVQNGTKKEEDLWAAEAQRNDQLDQVAQETRAKIEDAFQSGLELATARFAVSVGGAAGPLARRALSDAQKMLAHVRADPKSTQADVNRALKAVADARLGIIQYAREQAAALLQAEEAYQLAGIDPGNALAVARVRERFARRAARQTPAQDPAGRRQQQAAVRQTRHDTERARQQDRYDQITFEADIGRISHEVEIRQLQQLLKTIHGNRELRRQVQRQIYQLKHEDDQSAGFDLNVGNIKLPTVYEIRRAIKGGAGPSQHQVSVQNVNRINVSVSSEADVDAVFGRIDDITGTSLQAAGRAAGVR